MKKAHIWLGLCLLLGLAAMNQTSVAQEQATDVSIATGEGMDAVADGVTKAIAERDVQAVWSRLAPWRRNQFELFAAEFREDDAMMKISDAEAKQVCEYLDPQDLLKAGTAKQFQALGDPQLFGLLGGFYARTTGKSQGKPEDWKMDERTVGLLASQKVSGREIQCWGALARYSARKNASITQELRPTPQGWVLTGLTYGMPFGENPFLEYHFSFELVSFLSAPLGLAHDTDWTGLQKYRTADGEWLLGSVRDHLRIQWAKTGEPPTSVMDTGLDLEAFLGEHYSVQPEVLEARDGFDAAIFASPTRSPMLKGLRDPVILLEFNWDSGKSRFETFVWEKDLRAALKK